MARVPVLDPQDKVYEKHLPARLEDTALTELISDTVAEELPRFDAMALYGALGAAVAMQSAAADAVAAGGGVVYLRAGTYTYSETLAVNQANVHFEGDGWKTVLNYTGSGAAVRLGDKANTSAINGMSVSKLRIAGSASASIGLHLVGVQMSHFQGLRIDSFSGLDAIGACYDTAAVGGYQACINNTWVGGFINNCYHGLKLTKDAADPGSDGCNHNTVVGLRVANFFGIGIDNDAGENNAYYGCDASSSHAGTTGVRINDDVCAFYQIRTDNSSGGVGGADAVGIHITANGRDHVIINPTGNGPAERIKYDDELNTMGLVIRNGFNRWAGDVDFDRVPTVNGVPLDTGGSGGLVAPAGYKPFLPVYEAGGSYDVTGIDRATWAIDFIGPSDPYAAAQAQPTDKWSKTTAEVPTA